FRDVDFTVSVPQSFAPGNDSLTLSVTSATHHSTRVFVGITLVIRPEGVHVTVNPTGAPAGTSLSMNVTNTGINPGTFDLALAGPALVVASLDQTQVTLAPGQSANVPIRTQSADFAVTGPLELLAVATSTSNPAIEDAASAELSIPATRGMTAE